MVKRNGKCMISTFAVAFLLFAGLLPVFSGGVQGAVPEWEVGQKWALAGEKDLGAVYDSMEELFMDQFLDGNAEYFWDAELISSDFKGNIFLNMLFEVVEVTDTTYVVEVKYAGAMNLEGEFSFSAKFVEPGTYITYYSPFGDIHEDVPLIEDAANSTRTMSVEVNVIAGAYGAATFTVDKTELGILKVEAQAQSYVKGDLSTDDYLKTERYYSEDRYNYDDMHNVTYENYEIDWNANASGTMNIEFNGPALFVQTRAEQGDVWNVDTTVIVSGTYEGTVDVNGIPDEVEEDLFTSVLKEYGLDSFPLNLSDFFMPDSDGKVEDGVVKPVSGPIDAEMTCLRIRDYNDPVHGNIEVLEIASNGGGAPTTFYYSPENGYIVRITTAFNEGGIGLSLVASSVPVDDASSAYDAIKQQVDARSDKIITSADRNEGSNDDSTLLWLAVGIIAVVVVAAVALIAMRKKAPLPPTPPAPPMQ